MTLMYLNSQVHKKENGNDKCHFCKRRKTIRNIAINVNVAFGTG